jgi:RNA-directed DNA polymerase
LKPKNVSTKQERIATLARRNPEMAITTLHHHLDLEWMMYAYEQTRKDGANGVDGKGAEEYSANLRENLEDLLRRLKTGEYYAPPVRRVYIPKNGSEELRPIGIPTFEDKIAQRAILMLLEPLYEQDFLTCSHGFRRGRNAHGALRTLRTAIMEEQGRWILEVDIRKFFDTVNKSHLREFLRKRVADGVVRRLIDKWLKAGILEEGEMSYQKHGTPQGGVLSPLLANIYLHYVQLLPLILLFY